MVSEVSERKDDPKDKTGVGEAWRFKVSALADPLGGIHEAINDCAYIKEFRQYRRQRKERDHD